MTDFRRCVCCSGTLEPAQQFRFLVETATLDNPAHLAQIRRMPAANGRPVPVCTTCQELLESSALSARPAKPNPAAANSAAAGVLLAVGVLSVGWLIKNALLGPRS